MTRIDEWRTAGVEVSVAGMGKSGVSATRLLQARDVHVYLSDGKDSGGSREAAKALRADFGEKDLSIAVGHHDLERIARSAALVVSPGIPPEAPVIQAALRAGKPVLAEAQLGFYAMPDVSCIAITGTNGKTTTTALADHLFRAAGTRSVAAGNIGMPICEVALAPEPPEWIVAELSSFQLHDMPDVRPTAGILTNLAPDHLDRYPTVSAYYADKARLFANATSRSIWVSNLDDAESRKMIAKVPGRHLSFTVAPGTRSDAWFDHDNQQLRVGSHVLADRRDLRLLGDHNVANALAAALALHAVGVSLADLAKGMQNFKPLTHRLEPVREVNGVLWINDSKATNVASTEVAVRGMTRPFVLLLGGRHKGQPYTSLIDALRPHAVAVVAYGEAGNLIADDLKNALRVVHLPPGTSFEAVISTAAELAPRDGAVLLSPACSSFDMFTGYDARGAAFRAIVEAM